MQTINLKIFNNALIAIGIIDMQESMLIPAIDTAKLAITFIIMCPETILANKRIPRLIGLNKKDINSITVKKGAIYVGMPSGQKCLK